MFRKKYELILFHIKKKVIASFYFTLSVFITNKQSKGASSYLIKTIQLAGVPKS